MADRYMSMDNLKFVMSDVHNIKEVLSYDRYSDVDMDMVDMVLQSVKDYSDQELFPYLKELDEDSARYEDGKIIVPKRLATILPGLRELGLYGTLFDYELGGSQLPHMVGGAMAHILDAANNNVGCYIGLTNGAAGLITSFASKELIEKYALNMISGKWTGTMCLTEPQAGSSLSDVNTSATPQADGSYKIKGQKIFISGGDHQHTENIIHLVLARIDGAPAGTKGISLFVVPKNRIKEDGSLEYNDVFTAGDFQKLGQKGWSTAHLAFGDNDDSHGWLVGEANQGLRYMFQMMNGARIEVGSSATAISTAAYYASLQYAQERPQGRRVDNRGRKKVDAEQSLIIEHADVRRMLLLQKAIVEGCLSLVTLGMKLHDMEGVVKEEEKEYYNLFLEVLTPIIKTYPAEKGIQSVSTGLQVLGGYGFTKDFPLEQYYRDMRIMTLYEGTTGIQSLDLLGRKLTMKNGKGARILMKKMQETIEGAMTYDDLKPYAKKLGANLKLTQEVLQYLMGFAMKGEFERYLSDATIFMEFFGTITIAWQWLEMATVAKQALVTGNLNYSADFYESKVHTMKFFYKYELERTTGLANILMNDEVLTIAKEKKEVFA